MTESLPKPTPSTVRPRVRAAIRRAVAERAAATNPVAAPPVVARDVATAAPIREERFRNAASRASSRERNNQPRQRNAEIVAATSLGRSRTRARPRLREPVLAPPVAEIVADMPPITPAPVAPTIRHQPLPTAIEPTLELPPDLRRPPLWLAVLAGGCWAVLFGWLMLGELGPHTAQNTRLLFGGAIVLVGMLTWGPLQWATRLPVLTWRGTVGWGILLWTLAFVPPPTERLVASLPDLPVYLLFFAGLFLAINALALPLVHVWGLRRYHGRRERFDARRVRRQANEIGIFVTLCAALAVLNILEIVTVVLLIAILSLSELVMLSLTK